MGIYPLTALVVPSRNGNRRILEEVKSPSGPQYMFRLRIMAASCIISVAKWGISMGIIVFNIPVDTL